MLLKFVNHSLPVDLLGHKHPVFPMDRVSVFLEFLNFLNSLNSLDIQVSVVSQRLHLNLLHFESLIVLKLFSMDLSVGLGPLDFLWIVFGLEVQMAFGPAESEDLAVVSHELHSVSRVDGGPAEIAFFDSHL